MIITQFPVRPAGLHEIGELFEMHGRNLDMLPTETVAIEQGVSLQTNNDILYTVLDSVSPDGTIAYFKQVHRRSYDETKTLNMIGTPITPPRTLVPYTIE